MKWFEHRTTDSNDLEARLIENRFGLAGYGMWVKLQEIISENIESTNLDDWGFVSPDETMESLANKIGCPASDFEDFVEYCDKNLITKKRNGRLFCQYVLERMNEYARKIVKREKSEKTDNPKNPRNNTTQSHHNTTPKKRIGKPIGTSAEEEKGKPKEPVEEKDYGDGEVNQILKAFESKIKHIPADSKPRQVAQNIRQLIHSFVKREAEVFQKLRGEPLTFDYVHSKAWEWYMQKDYAVATEKLETFKAKMKVFLDDVSKKLKEEYDQT